MNLKNFEDSYKHQKEYVEEFLKKHHRPLTSLALPISIECHRYQKRLDGKEFIVHIYEVLYYLIIFGFDDDLTLSIGVLHDSIEDGGMTFNGIQQMLNIAVAQGVTRLSKEKGIAREEVDKYFEEIFKHFREMIIKLIDRLANMKRSMIGYFNKDQLVKYIDEGKSMIVPRLEGFIALCEDPMSGNDFYISYNQYAQRMRIIRGLLKGYLQAAEEHVKLMRENEESKNSN